MEREKEGLCGNVWLPWFGFLWHLFLRCACFVKVLLFLVAGIRFHIVFVYRYHNRFLRKSFQLNLDETVM